MILSRKPPAGAGTAQVALARASAAIGTDVRPALVFALLQGPVRPSALARLIPGVTARQIGRGLQALERDGLILRRIYAEAPPRVEYRLTETGWILAPLVAAMVDCGEALGPISASGGRSDR